MRVALQERWLVKQRAALAAAVADASAARANGGKTAASSNSDKDTSGGQPAADSENVGAPAANAGGDAAGKVVDPDSKSRGGSSTPAPAAAGSGAQKSGSAAEAREWRAELDSRVKLLEGGQSLPCSLLHLHCIGVCLTNLCSIAC